MRSPYFTYRNIICLLSILFSTGILVLFVVSISQKALTDGMKDLQTRVVGTRVFLLKENPYTFHRDSITSEDFIDLTDTVDWTVNRLTVTPLALVLNIPFIFGSVIVQRIIWLLFQWVLLIGTLFIFISMTNSKTKKRYLCGLFAFISISYIWQTHLIWGQLYILYAFLLAVSYKIFVFDKSRDLLSGFIVGFTSCLRPTMGAIWAPMMFSRRKAFSLGGVLGFLFGILLPILIKSDIWFDYFSSMGIYSTSQLYLYEKIRTVSESREIMLGSNSSLQGIITYFFGSSVNSLILVVSMGLILVFAIIVSDMKKRNDLLFFIFCVVMLLWEVLIPAPRLPYSDIIFVVPFSILILNANIRQLNWNRANLFLPFIAYFLFVGSAAATYLLILYLILSIPLVKKEDRGVNTQSLI